jgi:hypothetical protein
LSGFFAGRGRILLIVFKTKAMITTPPIASLSGMFACLLSLSSSIAEAAVIYTYQGPEHANHWPVIMLGESVKGTITFAENIVTGDFGAANLLDYSFEVGRWRLSKADGSDVSAHFEVDGDGAITSWSFVIWDYTPSPAPRLVEFWTSSADLSPSGERISMNYRGPWVIRAATSGTWTLAPIPEPASAALLVISAAALLVRRRHRDGGDLRDS